MRLVHKMLSSGQQQTFPVRLHFCENCGFFKDLSTEVTSYSHGRVMVNLSDPRRFQDDIRRRLLD